MPAIIKGTKREDLVEAVIKKWCDDNPTEFKMYKEQMATYQALADRRPLWSDGRKFLHKMEIPATLYAAMQAKFGGQWTMDKETYKAFKSVFQIGIIGPGGTA